MEQFEGSLSSFPLPAVLQLLQHIGSTGRLRITRAPWSGEIVLHAGQMMAAHLGHEHGRAALEGIVLALVDADFVFSDEPMECAEEPLLPRGKLADYLARLVVEREQLRHLGNALDSVPRLVESAEAQSEPQQVTIEPTAVSLIPLLVQGWTLGKVAQRRGLARTLREIGMLHAAQLVRLERAPASESTVDASPPPHRSTPPIQVPRPSPGPARGWRKALLDLFIAEAPQPRSPHTPH